LSGKYGNRIKFVHWSWQFEAEPQLSFYTSIPSFSAQAIPWWQSRCLSYSCTSRPV